MARDTASCARAKRLTRTMPTKKHERMHGSVGRACWRKGSSSRDLFIHFIYYVEAWVKGTFSVILPNAGGFLASCGRHFADRDPERQCKAVSSYFPERGASRLSPVSPIFPVSCFSLR